MRKAVFFDVDGTLTTHNVWQGFMSYFIQHRLRLGTHIVFLIIHYPLYFIQRLGFFSEAKFRSVWAAHLGWYFRGFSIKDAESIWEWVVKEKVNKLWRDDTRALLDSHRSKGEIVVLISGGPVPLLRHIAGHLGVEHVIGTRFEVHKDKYTGRVLGPVCVDKHKVSLLHEYLRFYDFHIDFAESTAYADSISDIHLLELVGKPVAIYPTDNLREVAQSRGWKIYPED